MDPLGKLLVINNDDDGAEMNFRRSHAEFISLGSFNAKLNPLGGQGPVEAAGRPLEASFGRCPNNTLNWIEFS